MAGLQVAGGNIHCAIAWTPRDFSKALLRNVHAFLETRPVELKAAALIAGDFPAADCIAFLEAVCLWGNRAGTAALVKKKNTETEIRNAFSDACDHLQNDRLTDALTSVIRLKGLDVSFGSKHLRMLSPTKAVVLDSIIALGLGYNRTPDGYTKFLEDCVAIRDLLNGPTGSPNPIDLAGSWRLCDVEMAIYSKLRGF